jgi:glycosyltransferase involved in cell wall biosynthesis
MSAPPVGPFTEVSTAVVAVQIRDQSPVEPRLTAVPRPMLSVIIPAYNEAQRIGGSLAETKDYLDRQSYSYEIVLANDGSRDQTLAIARGFAKTHHELRTVSIPHGGKAAAIRAGMKSAMGDIVAFTDADLATPIAYLGPFIDAIVGGADVVIGSREGQGANRLGEPAYRHIMGRVFNRIVQLSVLPGIHDTQCGFKAFTRFACSEILRRSRLYVDAEEITGARVTAFDVEMLVIARKIGLKIEEIPVVWTYGDQSKVNPARDTFNNLRDIAQVKLNAVRGAYD